MKVRDEESMERKRDVFASATGTAKSLHLTLITPNGVSENAHSRIFQSILTLKDLFQE